MRSGMIAFSRIIGTLKLVGLAAICLTTGSALAPKSAFPKSALVQESDEKAEPNSLSQLVRQWSDALARHIPGKSDSPAMTIGKWSEHDLKSVLTYIKKLSAQPVQSAKRTLARGQIRRLLGMTDQEARDGDLNRILKQGALLHTDIALLELGTGISENPSDVMGLFADGRLLFSSYNAHWQLARQLLDSVSGVSDDPLVRQWYIATIAFMQSRRDYGYSKRNLKSALDIFPDDAQILFYAGVLHEIYASPVSQNNSLPSGWKVSYGPKESELKLAKQFLQKAVSANPDSMEARLHLGRVLGLLGRHQLAVAQLQPAHASIKDPQLQYYASLFLGHELELCFRYSEAKDSYERAASLFPAAQSPLLALSQLAHSRNDMESAVSFLQRVFALKIADLWKDDPWWSYDLAHARNASALVAEMHRMFGAPPR
jgi:tetratricopeptide (TPR) repeat protein